MGTRLKVLVACEFSGRVRDAFIQRGHDAYSCDLLPTDSPGPHLQMDVFEAIAFKTWDLMIAFPPCTHLCSSGAWCWKRKVKEQAEAIQFVKDLWNSPIERIAIENPIGILSTVFRKPDQIVQPFWFGDAYRKSTCLWLKNLPKLVPTNTVQPTINKIMSLSPSPDRWKIRSLTPQGLADAFALQWG